MKAKNEARHRGACRESAAESESSLALYVRATIEGASCTGAMVTDTVTVDVACFGSATITVNESVPF